MMKATSTPRMVTMCEPRRPTVLPKKPATMAPASGASGTVSSRFCESCADIFFARALFRSALQRVEFLDIDAGPVAEQHDQDGQADGRLGRRDGQDEEHEDLAAHVAEVVREGDEVQVDRQQHQLDGHQQHDQVLAVQEDADHRQREQHRAERQEVAQRESTQSSNAGHAWPPSVGAASAGATTVGGILTILRRWALVTLTCSEASIARESLRRRSVSAMAATMATSSSTAAICNG
mmetsp:Transcript_8082/g.15724  ORF Transcript_8082/g.15724 Transcript_8082/m.15724 type:complete len:236 (+) Transcript_8082:2683-3390(+)